MGSNLEDRSNFSMRSSAKRRRIFAHASGDDVIPVLPEYKTRCEVMARSSFIDQRNAMCSKCCVRCNLNDGRCMSVLEPSTAVLKRTQFHASFICIRLMARLVRTHDDVEKDH